MTSSSHPTTGGTESAASGERIETAARSVASDAAQAARDQAQNVYRQGAESASAAARGTAEAFDRTAGNLSAEGQETLAQAASYLSGRLSALAEQLESRSLDDLMGQARRLARDNPALFVGGSVAIGFALSRFFRASAPAAREPLQAGRSYGSRTYEQEEVPGYGSAAGPTYGSEAATPAAGERSRGGEHVMDRDRGHTGPEGGKPNG